MFEDFSLDSILEQPTQERSETPQPETVQETPVESPSEITDLNESGLTFSPIPETSKPELILGQEETKVEIPYDAEENAVILIELIDMLNIQACTPLARWKLRKKRGGKEVLRSMQSIFERSLAKEKLTDEEILQLVQYKNYLKDKEELEKAIPYTDDEKEALTKSAIPWLREKRIEIGGATSFFVQLALVQGSKIVQILAA